MVKAHISAFCFDMPIFTIGCGARSEIDFRGVERCEDVRDASSDEEIPLVALGADLGRVRANVNIMFGDDPIYLDTVAELMSASSSEESTPEAGLSPPMATDEFPPTPRAGLPLRLPRRTFALLLDVRCFRLILTITPGALLHLGLQCPTSLF